MLWVPVAEAEACGASCLLENFRLCCLFYVLGDRNRMASLGCRLGGMCVDQEASNATSETLPLCGYFSSFRPFPARPMPLFIEGEQVLLIQTDFLVLSVARAATYTQKIYRCGRPVPRCISFLPGRCISRGKEVGKVLHIARDVSVNARPHNGDRSI